MDFPAPDVPEALLRLTNQVFALEQCLKAQPESPKLRRIHERMLRELEAMGLSYHVPLGESYDETRTDCEATLTSAHTSNLTIQEVIKPLIRYQQEGFTQILQRAIVMVG